MNRLLAGVSDNDPLATTLYVDAQLALPDDMLHYFDRTSMAHSLEVRVPFLDHPLVEWAATVPTTLKLRRDTTKYVLKETARHLLPTFAIDKPKIGFFRQASSGWLRAQLDVAVDEYLSEPGTRVGAYLDVDAVRAAARDGRTHGPRRADAQDGVVGSSRGPTRLWRSPEGRNELRHCFSSSQ